MDGLSVGWVELGGLGVGWVELGGLFCSFQLWGFVVV